MSGWDVTNLKENLPPTGNLPVQAAATSESQLKPTGATEPWVEKTAYDYQEVGDRNWDGNARVYEWDGEEGDIGPEHPELENILFGRPDERNPQGINFNEIAQINVTQEGVKRIQPINQFQDAGLHPAMRRNVELCGYNVPTPIQRYCIPAIKTGHDLIAIAQTGKSQVISSGKTAAYLIPILNHLMGKAKKLAAPRPSPNDYQEGVAPPVRAEPLVVIICPARELAVQIFTEARKFCYRTMLRPCVVYGGAPIKEQVLQLQRGCDVLVGTPGRLVDMMNRPHVLSFRRVKYIVIDEADEMLESDWSEDVNQIMSGGEQEEGNIKYMLFSATFPVAVRKLARSHLAESHIRVRVGRVGSTHHNIVQDIIFTDVAEKKRCLLDLLRSMKPARTIIFVNSKHAADEIDDFLFHHDFPSTSMHGDRTQREREDSMRAFRSGAAPILVATGLSARGIDVRNVAHVINFDLPSMDHGGIQEYIHRIGRTGRIGHRGTATSFYTQRDEPIAPLLVMTLMETKQTVPEFLQEFAPTGAEAENLKFEPDTDEEDENEANGGGDDGDGWGGSASANGGPATKKQGNNDTGNDGWGSGVPAAAAEDTWGSSGADASGW